MSNGTGARVPKRMDRNGSEGGVCTPGGGVSMGGGVIELHEH